ncbi:MAG: carbohydrate-binding protein [Ruminococcus sp.]|nr:carbohydrate-binding protein [Ruminococcus sp.]
MNGNFKKLTALLTGIITVFSSAGIIFPETESAITANCASKVLAFPGAVGGGRYATGGRGGEVYHVTNLNDSGAGSFRDAVSKSNRIVVFDVSGTIELKSNILCSSNVTIAGQTAPGGAGITLKNYKMGMSGNNIICRYISSRPGPYKATSSGNDAWGGDKGSSSIIDHCSMSWTTDEQWGLYSNNEYYTVQYSIIGPADSWGGHKKGLHGFGLMMGKGYSTFDHNLIIHNVSRNFRGKVEGTETADFTNNVIYNWAYQTAYGTIGHLNYVNNTLKMGNGTTGGKHYVNVDSSTKPQNFGIFLKGNRMLNKDGSVYAEVTDDNWNGISIKQSITDTYGVTKDTLKSDKSFQTIVDGENVSTADTCESAEDSYNHVISFAGNGIAPDKRTAVDRQCAEETKTGTGNMSGTASYDEATDTNKENIDKYNIQCGVTYEYPSAVMTKTITDQDNDGMDDEWELARGLDPSDPSDTNGDYCGQGYTNIEYYINDLTVDSFPEGVVKLSPETQSVVTTPARSAYETIEAEDFTEQNGVRTEDLSTGGKNIGFIENGDWIKFKKVDFEDGANSISLNISGNSSKIEICLDSLENVVSTVDFKGTSGFSDYQSLAYNINKIEGVHDLYLKFTCGEGYLLNADNFVFSKNPVAISGELFKEISVSETAYPTSWNISSNANNGSLIFGDRDFTAENLPANLKGGEILLTACNAKSATGTTATFTAGEDITLYIGVDSRVETLPEWLSDYKNTLQSFSTMTVSSGLPFEVVFKLYSKQVKKGEKITLGSNGQSANCVNYTVFAVKSDGKPNDINEDGLWNSVDLVLMNKHLLNISSLTAEQYSHADLNGDGSVDVFDLVLLRQEVIKNS